MKNHPWQRLSAFLLAGMLAACLMENEKSAGGATDVPNYLAALGPLTTDHIEASSAWGFVQSRVYNTLAGRIPLTAPQTGNPVAPAPLPKSGVLPKASALDQDSIQWDYADSARGLATAYRHVLSGYWEYWDTSLVRYDQQAKAGDYAGAFFLRTRGKGQFNFLANVIHRYVGEDTDSNGILDRRTNFVSLQWWGKDEQETWYTIDHPGLDADFRTGLDNPVELFEKVVTLGPDTLMYEYLEDRDGDQTIWTMPLAGIDSSLFRYISAAPGAAGSGVKRSEIRATVAVYEPPFLRPMEVRKAFIRNQEFTGAVHSMGLRGFREDSTYLKGDSIDIVLARTPLWPDTVASMEQIFRVQTSSGIPDALLHARADAVLRNGPIAKTHFLLRPDTSLGMDAVYKGGTISLTARLALGETVSLQGRYEEDLLTAEITEAGGKPYTVVWDRKGTLLHGPSSPSTAR